MATEEGRATSTALEMVDVLVLEVVAVEVMVREEGAVVAV